MSAPRQLVSYGDLFAEDDEAINDVSEQPQGKAEPEEAENLLADPKAWDDTELIRAWDSTIDDYRKFHISHLDDEEARSAERKLESKIGKWNPVDSQSDRKRKRAQHDDDGQLENAQPEIAEWAAYAAPPQTEDDALQRLNTAWYYVGYYTACYQNRRLLQTESQRAATRSKLSEPLYEQKTAGSAVSKRKAILSEQSQKAQNQQSPAAAGPDKDTKKMAKIDIPVSLDIDPFSSESYTDPQSAMDKMLSAKDVKSPENVEKEGNAELKSPAAKSKEAVEALTLRAKRAETEVLTLKHQLLDTKAELKAAEDRLREKDAMIKDQEARIDELIESRVPMDDMNEVMEENSRLQKDLAENEALLAECQKLLEEYVAADEQS
ncbi:hypothetical protein LPJ68_001207 [Coemansia sp. RSA 1086]|nr:hypothetical protein LPJ68_001207 [Coemansia sp. RSA 1086]